jgi:hypothetical protein
VKRIAHGATWEFTLDPTFALQLLINSIAKLFVDQLRLAFDQPMLLQKGFVDLTFDIDQQLINADDVKTFVSRIVVADVDPVLFGDRKVMFDFKRFPLKSV